MPPPRGSSFTCGCSSMRSPTSKAPSARNTRNTVPPSRAGSPEPARRLLRENRSLFSHSPSTPHVAGSPENAPRRGAARAARGLHRRLRRVEFRDAAGEEVPRPLAPRGAARDPPVRRRSLDRRARELHGNHPLRARPPASPDSRRGRARNRRGPAPAPRHAGRQHRQRLAGRRQPPGPRGRRRDPRPRERARGAAGSLRLLLYGIPEERPAPGRAHRRGRNPAGRGTPVVPKGRNARGAGDLQGGPGGGPLGTAPARARERGAYGRAAAADGGGPRVRRFQRGRAPRARIRDPADRRPALDGGVPSPGIRQPPGAVLEGDGPVKRTLAPEEVQMALAQIGEANRGFAEHFPGDSPRRQPVHTVYGGAQVFRSDTAPRLGALARRSLEEYAPEPGEFGRALGLPGELAARIHDRVARKLEREPVEDFRIDFEDGYGTRPDDEEDGHAESAAVELANGR